ncbi:LAMI_0A01574g1_1 [Lachancea mirantina]|uniref:Vacuolar protein-sorting-associated protein 36 n=1 Tax=Lachancea mirantina TaxID=1230905 RepID=A0A1G4IMF7_9SACH|nr:LAMI_0A01574g1_1 [Lachancea mirantina]
MHLSQWKYVETTSSGQPVLRDNEQDIYVEQVVGLYQGKAKMIGKQKGRIYLTTQRLIYMDDAKPKEESIALELDDITSVEYSSKFLKKSAKLILFLLKPNGSSLREDKERGFTVNWVCPICMMTNESSSDLNESLQEMPPCINCGIRADYEMLKDSISRNLSDSHGEAPNQDLGSIECPACTFLNNLYMSNCEICGCRLPTENKAVRTVGFKDSRIKVKLESSDGIYENSKSYVQLSFRKSDGTMLWQATQKVLEDRERKRNSPILNQGVTTVNGVSINEEITLTEDKLSKVGIAGLEKAQENQIIKNDILLNKALTDLNSLMNLASEIELLYDKDSSAKTATKSPFLVVDREKFLNKSLFIDEIAREVYDFIMSEFKEQKEREGVILITLVDVYALYNKSMRIGTGLVSPQELREACEKFEKLGLRDLTLKKLNNRVLCVSSGDSFDFIKGKILKIVSAVPGADLLQLTQKLNSSSSNAWTVGIIMEVLQNCVNEGNLLIDEQISGIHYYVNCDWKIN